MAKFIHLPLQVGVWKHETVNRGGTAEMERMVISTEITIPRSVFGLAYPITYLPHVYRRCPVAWSLSRPMLIRR